MTSALAGMLLWENYASDLMQKEQQIGRYAQWSAADKEALINALTEMGHLDETEAVQEILAADTSEVEKSTLADQILLEFLDQNEYLRTYETAYDHSTDTITSGLLTLAIMGPQESWPAEKRVWWQRLTNPNVNSHNDMVFVNPKQGDISEAEAIAIAQKAISQTLHVPERELESAQAVADLYITDEHPSYRRWLVSFNILKQGSANYIERVYEAFVDHRGNLIADPDYNGELLEAKAADLTTNDEEKTLPPLLERFREYAEFEESSLVREWTIEGKAEYSAELRPQVLAVLESKDLALLTDHDARYPTPHGEIIASCLQAYGLPKEEDIQLDDALELARLYVSNQYGLDEQTNMDTYTYYEYFDVTDADRPLWKFVFFPVSFEGLDAVPVYKIKLDAYTGEQVSAERHEWKQLFDGSPYNPVWY